MPNPKLKSVHLSSSVSCTAGAQRTPTECYRCSAPEDGELVIPALSLPPTDRVVILDDVITHESSVRVRRSLHRFEQESDESVIVKINTPGGRIDEMFAIHDMLRTCAMSIITVIIGNAYSAGSVILQGGEVRVMSQNSAIMLHQGSFHMDGVVNLDDLRQIVADANFEEERCFNILMARTGQHRRVIEKWHEGNTYMTAIEAIENNLADALLVPRDPATEPLDRGLASRAKRLNSRVSAAFESLHAIADFTRRISGFVGTGDDKEDELRSRAAKSTGRLRLPRRTRSDMTKNNR